MSIKRNASSPIVPALVIVAFTFAAVFGWCWNIVKLFSMDFDASVTVLLVLRVLGIFVAPFGVVLGYF